jgi:hypothetical protein
MRMEPFEAYRYYQSLKLHFENESYNAPKYNYKTSAKPQTFWKRKDKYFFAKVGRMFDTPPELINYYAAHFVADNNWVGDMLSDEQVYRDWQKRTESMGYNFQQDLEKVNVESFDQLFDLGNQYPKVVEAYLSNDINIESVAILNKLTSFMSRADKTVSDPILWPDVSRKIRKYSLLMNVNTDKMKKIIFKVFTS